ncbi:MAG: hypothetical protein AAF638_06420 [Pseudomonadota bacterium]
MTRASSLLGAAAVLSFLFVAPAYATGTISCVGVAGADASVDITVSSTIVPDVLALTATIGGETFSTRAGVGTPIAVAQDLDDGTQLRIEATDDQALERLVSVTVVRAEGKDGPVQAGILTGRISSAPIVCEGP